MVEATVQPNFPSHLKKNIVNVIFKNNDIYVINFNVFVTTAVVLFVVVARWVKLFK